VNQAVTPITAARAIDAYRGEGTMVDTKLRSVVIRMEHYELLRQMVDVFSDEARTTTGMKVRVTMMDVVGFSLEKLAAEFGIGGKKR